VTSANDEPTDKAEKPPKPASLVPGVVLLIVAGVLIVITLVKPDLPRWLTIAIAVAAVLVVVALLIYAFRVFRDVTRPGGSR
jgi:protein-S-isoprenylcysteine O-methyltransferase Ste14